MRLPELNRKPLWKVLRYVIASLLLAIIYYVVLSSFLYFGEDARLRKQNRKMEQQLSEWQRRFGTLEGALKSLQERDRSIYKTVFNAYPPNVSVEKGAYYQVDMDTVKGRQLFHYIRGVMDEMVADASGVRTLADTIFSTLEYLGSSATNIPSIIPVKNVTPGQFGASVGKKISPFYKIVMTHNGLDIMGAVGTEIIAPADGVVETVGKNAEKSAGNVFTINHQNGYKTRYANVGDVYVLAGQKIKQGQVIGRIGMSGMSLAPHLHYEVMLGEKYMDPIHYFFADLDPHSYAEAIAASQNSGQSLD